MWLVATMLDSTVLNYEVLDRVASSPGSADGKGHEKEEKRGEEEFSFLPLKKP